jgi:hypothetical protein
MTDGNCITYHQELWDEADERREITAQIVAQTKRA